MFKAGGVKGLFFHEVQKHSIFYRFHGQILIIFGKNQKYRMYE